MKKWQKISIWIVSIVIVLVVGGLFAANYAVDKVLDSMVGMSVDDLFEEEADDDASNDTPTPSDNEESTNSNGAEDADNGSDVSSEETSVSNNNSSNQSSNTNSNNNNNNNASNSNGTQSNSNNEGSSQAGNEGSEQSGSEGSGSSGYTAEIDKDKAKEVQENVTLTDKAKVIAILSQTLSASDISTLQSLASGGLTVEEKREAKELLLNKLTEDQYNELIAIAAKHGLSQGKTYAESKKE